MKRKLITLVAGLALLAAAPGGSTVIVSGNTVDTAAGENGSSGWWFNRDASTSTPYAFDNVAASTGRGSLHVLPIGGSAADKMVAELFAFLPVSDLQSFSYDFRIAGNGTSADANDFYLNVYANIDDSTNFYDCRFDYVPSVGSTSGFTTFTVTPATVADNVRLRGTRIGSCPTTLAGMPAGSHVRVFAINVGDTSASDAGLAGHVDNVVVMTSSGTTTYDFEPAPADKDACKKGGWEALGFRNQGECIAFHNASSR